MSVPPRPPMAADGLVAHTAKRRIAAPPAEVYRVVVLGPLESLVVGGGGLAGVAGTQTLPGPAWGREGARRKLLMTDGSSAYESVVQASPDRASGLFRYQVWGFSGLPRLLLDHAQGRFVFDPDGEGTALAWTYAFKPRASPLKPAVRRFVRTRFAPFMEAALSAMQERAEAGPPPADPA